VADWPADDAIAMAGSTPPDVPSVTVPVNVNVEVAGRVNVKCIRPVKL
jgi:hypothetical protein